MLWFLSVSISCSLLPLHVVTVVHLCIPWCISTLSLVNEWWVRTSIETCERTVWCWAWNNPTLEDDASWSLYYTHVLLAYSMFWNERRNCQQLLANKQMRGQGKRVHWTLSHRSADCCSFEPQTYIRMHCTTINILGQSSINWFFALYILTKQPAPLIQWDRKPDRMNQCCHRRSSRV